GEAAAERSRTLRGGTPCETRQRPSREIRLSGLYAYQRQDSERRFHDPPQDVEEEVSGQAEGLEEGAFAETAPRFRRNGSVAAKRTAWLVPVLCCPRQLRSPASVPRRPPTNVAPHAATTQSTRATVNVGEILQAQQTLASDA